MTATTPKNSELTVVGVDNTARETLTVITSHPAVSLTTDAIKATFAGLKLVVDHEREYHAVQNFFVF